ncbi:MAG TPA: DUF1294 domain-containing protein [Roseomonas sp.]|nr:DUF1294 domain-containing protein [Roseomonas sp.]
MPADMAGWVVGAGCWLVGINSVAVIAFHHDKRMAQRGGWRVSEQTLLAIALLGGSGGALAARAAFRHKTRKQPFATRLQAIFVLHGLALAGLAMVGLTRLAAPSSP